MNENREEYKEKITAEITEKLQLDMDAQYSVDEINTLLDRHNMRGGIIKFVPKEPLSGSQIVEVLVEMDLIVTDAIHKELGFYENKIKCSYCGGYFDDKEIFQIQVDRDYPIVCNKCRRERKIKLSYWDFKHHIEENEREEFMRKELEYGLDYSDYIEKLKYYSQKHIS